MEKFFLRTFLSNDKLNIIDQENIDVTVFFTELCHCRIVSVTDGIDQFIRKTLGRNI